MAHHDTTAQAQILNSPPPPPPPRLTCCPQVSFLCPKLTLAPLLWDICRAQGRCVHWDVGSISNWSYYSSHGHDGWNGEVFAASTSRGTVPLILSPTLFCSSLTPPLPPQNLRRNGVHTFAIASSFTGSFLLLWGSLDAWDYRYFLCIFGLFSYPATLLEIYRFAFFVIVDYNLMSKIEIRV
jgi:hypothetical protein